MVERTASSATDSLVVSRVDEVVFGNTQHVFEMFPDMFVGVLIFLHVFAHLRRLHIKCVRF